MILRNINSGLVTLIYPILLLFLLLFPLSSYAIEQFYTIQTGSFAVFENAKKQFDSLKQQLDDNKLDYLRIEKVNEHFKVRLGNFENHISAEEFLRGVKPSLSGAMIIADFLNHENIVELYRGASSSAEAARIEQTLVMIETQDTERSETVGLDISTTDLSDTKSYIDQLITDGRYEEAKEAYKKAIDESEDDREKAIFHKYLGDLFVLMDDYRAAAEEFMQALSLSREFPEEERLQMAIYMSWGERRDEAIAEFKSILEENPGNLKARVNLVKVLSWSGRSDEAIEAYKKAINESKDDGEKAVLHKELGDLYVTKENYRDAADTYLNALSLARNVFSLEERIQIAIYLSWGGRLSESMEELKLILKKDPSNLKARVHLAKTLSWSGRQDEAIKEAERVLRESPDNKDALLVKANAFRWRGSYIKAIPLYNKILGKGEDFDTRLGHSYAYFLAGNIQAARRSSKLLKPTYPYQEKELNQFTEEMLRATRPYFDIRYSYYKDSDDNILDRYLLGFGFWAGNWKSDIQYRHTDAKDNVRDVRAEDLTLRTYSKVTDSFGIGGGLGLTQMTNEGSQNYFTWNIKTDVDILDGVVGISLARDALTDIAQLIENRIRVTNASLYISQRLTDRISLYGNYSYKDYSDDNSANDFQLSPSYIIYNRNPRINLGYRIRYLDFERQSGGGYFDPNDFISHQIFASLSFDKERFYGYIEPFVGYQSFKRYGDKSEDVIGGGYGILGIKISKKIALEMNAEGGNYALETAAGWKYFILGVKLLIFL